MAVRALLFSSGAVACAIQVRLELGWRHSLGSSPSGHCLAPYPISYNDQQCNGLTSAPSGAASADACQQAACAVSAELYQFCPGGGVDCGDQSCWIGSLSGGCHGQKGWISSAQNGSVPFNPPASQPGFDDSTWDIIDLPHDQEITGNYSNSSNGGEGFLPYQVRGDQRGRQGFLPFPKSL